MAQAPISDRLHAIFRGELQDHVRSIEQDLLALERTEDAEARVGLQRALFRSVHSLKGAARVVGEAQVEAICHRLEEIFQHLDGAALGEAGLVQLLLAAVDAIRQSDQPGAEATLAALAPRLDQAARGEPMPAPVPRTAPRPDPVAPAKPSPAAAEPAPIADGVVRMPAAKLDLLVARSEQLLVVRRRADAQAAALAQIQDGLRAGQRQWPDTERKIAQAFTADADDEAARARKALGARRALSAHQTGQRRLAHDLQSFGNALAAERRGLDQAATALDGEIRRARMFPFAAACEGLERAARDLSGKDKTVQIAIEGGEIELDRSILEGLRDPLLHLVRNAADHGIEPVEERQRAGKRTAGRVTVAARLRGMQVEVEVADDGRGVDPQAVRAEAQRRGDLGDGGLNQIFQPGFSTSATVTEVSGRGVGLDVVKSRVEAMRGTVEVSSQAGAGTRFVLTLPLTLTTIRGLLVRVAGQTFALDTTNIRRLLRVDPGELLAVEGRTMLRSEHGPIVLSSLASQLGLAAPATPAAGKKLPVVVLGFGDREAAFAVDELLAAQEVLIRSLGARLKRVRHAAGGTILPDGQVALILHAHDLIESALGGAGDAALRPVAPEAARRARKRLLLADDSVTTRTLMKTILEGAGYDVTAVVDGAEAWRLVQEQAFDLLVSDVEMPRMDGVALTETIRASARWSELPVILVTALDSEDDRGRGLRAGATAYLVKSAFDQRELLEIVEQLA